MTSVNDIFRDIIGRVSAAYGREIVFQFGDWEYIADVLTTMSKSNKTSSKKYPIICLYSPYTEEISGKIRVVNLDILIAVNTLKEYTNEQREQTSFSEVLRPIYQLLIKEIGKDKRIASNYSGVIPHRKTENYRYGRKGVDGGDGKPFRDFIDAIEIGNLELTIKDLKCYDKV